mgnify:FL=1
MCTFKEILYGINPKDIDPTIKTVKIQIKDFEKEENKILDFIERNFYFNTHFLKKIPSLEKSFEKTIYFFSLNYDANYIRLCEEYKFRNLKFANPSLLLKFNLDNFKLKKKMINLTCFPSKFKSQHYVLTFSNKMEKKAVTLDISNKAFFF